MAVSKNNPDARKGGAVSGYKKTGSGKIVIPALYAGRWIGHGQYMAGQIDGKLIYDERTGKPYPYRDLDTATLASL